ncbi:hypothetical protein [Limnovirga soli]|uniref:Uncharacterized protein n=1 Tax=Limnovirga soli TaxID=2656915 RepID=A0A8J8FFV4_9BACT|nr:hypothetical protein [Limnovirga soli]NNV57285.1 hypothetical protein [Limnovirga soli]
MPQANNKILVPIWYTILKLADLLIIQYKLAVLVTLFLRYQDASSKEIKNVYLHLLIPIVVYGVINIGRLLYSNLLALLFVEMILNVVFAFMYGSNHLLFLLLSAISTLIVVVKKRVYIKNANQLNTYLQYLEP